MDEYAQEFPCNRDPGGARGRRGGVERVERDNANEICYRPFGVIVCDDAKAPRQGRHAGGRRVALKSTFPWPVVKGV